ncbi:DUF1254 domain-containing protein [Nocardioides sp. SLBN-35]|uniref:DUF1254 domain-containing protein n=1 Tax=Nocardioides sp. SLBN-35 TaxID=2768445 RepID=UPI001152146D|nr:DUF1254 domain-containing protein [Nocardioides sp. SLBN-35]TQK69538.1 hypothetical protein FBY23_1304 [Nocardioides sp. SLBN-35]
MGHRKTSHALALAGLLAGVVTSALATTAAPASADGTTDRAAYDAGYRLGLEAYRYGLPLVTTDATFQAQTSVDVPDDRGFGPVNRLNPVRSFITPEDRSVVAPNLDTLYSIAWLDLREEPQVVHVPKVRDRYFVIPLMSPYTENFANLGSVEQTPPGDYAIVGPSHADARLPKHVTRVESPYDRVWIIERIYADNDDLKDQAKVHRIQDATTVTPLSRYPRPAKAATPSDPDTTAAPVRLPTGMDFYDRLGDLLAAFPPPAADAPELAELARIGIGAGRHPSTDATLDADTRAGMESAIAAGQATVLQDAMGLYGQGFAQHNGYLVTPTGSYGTDYRLRSVVTQVGLGALRPEQAMYPLALLDRTGQPLTGAKRYVVHLPADQLPPLTDTGFWSLTLYDNDGFVVANEIDRYAINDRTDLHRNADGSFDLYVQATRPSDPEQAQNWLPTPAGGFRLLWRMYGTQTTAIPGILDGTGWRVPAVLPAG